MDDGGGGGGVVYRSAATVKASAWARPEDVFRDFRARRAGIVNALTKDVDKFYEQCDPVKDNLCLYGLPNETWQVGLPPALVPPEIPEPTIGINYPRDGIARNDWLLIVAAHSDSWLLSVAFYFSARYVFDKEHRAQLFTMINGLPSVFEVVSENLKDNQPLGPNNGSKSKSGSKTPKQQNHLSTKLAANHQARPKRDDEEEEEAAAAAAAAAVAGGGRGRDEEQVGVTLCGACGEAYTEEEFWIGCDACEAWFHGECVGVTPAQAERIKRYECPGCDRRKRIKLAHG